MGAIAFAESILLAIRAIRQTAGLEADGVDLQYEIADLTHSSPATAVLRARIDPSQSQAVAAVQDRFVATITAITEGVTPTYLDYPTLRTYQRLGALATKGRFVNLVRSNGAAAPVGEQFKNRLDLELSRDVQMIGSIQGRLKAYSTEGRNLVRLHPRIAPPLTGEFGSSVRQKILGMLEREVIVKGRLRYRPASYYPYFVRIRDVELLHRPDDAPTLASLRGAGRRNAAGAGEDFIRKLRRAW